MRKKSWVEDGVFSREAFEPDFTAKSWDANGSAVDRLEASINWEDDASVTRITLDHPNGRFGAARVLRKHVETLARLRNATGLSLERRHDPDQPDNPHHGNIVFAKGMRRGFMKAIADAILIDAEYVPPERPQG